MRATLLFLVIFLSSCAFHSEPDFDPCPPGNRELWCWGEESNSTAKVEEKSWYQCVNWSHIFRQEYLHVLTTGKMPPPSLNNQPEDPRFWMCK